MNKNNMMKHMASQCLWENFQDQVGEWYKRTCGRPEAAQEEKEWSYLHKPPHRFLNLLLRI